MLTYFAILLTYALLNFGAVPPENWYILTILWIAGFAFVLSRRLMNGTATTADIIALAVSAALLLLGNHRTGTAVFAGCWAWCGARRSRDGVLRLFNILIIIGVLEALLGLVQFFVSPGWIFGYITTSRSSGTLINKNHFAGLLELLLPLCFGQALIGLRRYGDLARSYVYILAASLMGMALIFSLSRSGILSFLITMAFLAVLVGSKGSTGRLEMILGVCLLALVGIGAAWVGLDVVVDQYSGLFQEDRLLQEGRLDIFRDTVDMIRANPLGVGLGHYQDRFRQFQTVHNELLFDHTHNDYLEFGAEMGIPLALLFLGGIGWIGYRMIRGFLSAESPARSGILLACIGSVMSILIHSFTDFNLQIPSNAMLFCGFLGIGLALSSSEHNRSVEFE